MTLPDPSRVPGAEPLTDEQIAEQLRLILGECRGRLRNEEDDDPDGDGVEVLRGYSAAIDAAIHRLDALRAERTPTREQVEDLVFQPWLRAHDTRVVTGYGRAIKDVLALYAASSLTPQQDVEEHFARGYRQGVEDGKHGRYEPAVRADQHAEFLARVPPAPQPPWDNCECAHVRWHREGNLMVCECGAPKGAAVPPAPAAQARSAGRVDLEQIARELWTNAHTIYRAEVGNTRHVAANAAAIDYIAARLASLQRARETDGAER